MRLWMAIAAAVIGLDQITKHLAVRLLPPHEPAQILPFVNFDLAYNTGAAFSFLASSAGWQRWFFVVLASAVSLVLTVWLLRLPRDEWLTGLALGLVIGGAVGNLVDRIQLGYVVDFVDVHFKGWHYPAFNVADSAITVGVALLLTAETIEVLYLKRQKQTLHLNQRLS